MDFFIWFLKKIREYIVRKEYAEAIKHIDLMVGAIKEKLE